MTDGTQAGTQAERGAGTSPGGPAATPPLEAVQDLAWGAAPGTTLLDAAQVRRRPRARDAGAGAPP